MGLDRYLFRASEGKKHAIAENILGVMDDQYGLSSDSASFISNWIVTGPDEKTKAYYDIWNKILDEYEPKERPILFRFCMRVSHKPIQSFSGRLAAVEKFSGEHKGHVLIFETRQWMIDAEACKAYPIGAKVPGSQNFISLNAIMEKDLRRSNPKIRRTLYDKYKGEDEYIVRSHYSYFYDLKWSS